VKSVKLKVKNEERNEQEKVNSEEGMENKVKG
jgi:hypothetical protein